MVGEGIAIAYPEMAKFVPAREKPLKMDPREQVIDTHKPLPDAVLVRALGLDFFSDTLPQSHP